MLQKRTFGDKWHRLFLWAIVIYGANAITAINQQCEGTVVALWNDPDCKKGKERKSLYSAILVRTHTLKALRHGSHSFTCKLHHACLSFVSVHQMVLPLTEVADIKLQLTTDLSTQRDEKLSWPGWLTYSGWLTHISGHPSATGRAQDSESSPAKD